MSIPWDISFPHMLPFIDGVSHVKKIAKEANMDVDCVKRSLRILKYYDLIIISDVFKFSNVYKLNSERGAKLLADPNVLEQIKDFIYPKNEDNSRSASSINQLHIGIIITYSSSTNNQLA